MTAYEMAQLMGTMATDEEGRAMLDILHERQIEQEELSDREFAALIPEAVRRAKENAKI